MVLFGKHAEGEAQSMKECKLLNRKTGELRLLTIFATMHKG